MEKVFTVKERIFEKLATQPEPPGYEGKIPWIVQQQISATNGIHFKNTVGVLNEYPIPEIPVTPGGPDSLLMDIGCGWGRWMAAALGKNYIPVGVDIRLEFCEMARKVVQDNRGHGYTVVADLQQLPFWDNVFDVVWSFSVIQHTHYNRLVSCLEQIKRTLKPSGYCFLEFPNKKGFRNRFGPAAAPNNMNFDSWNVRYYSPEEYQNIFLKYFDNFQFYIHSALGIGVLPGDLKYAKGFRNKTLIGLSRILTRMADVIKPLKQYADSIYIKSSKNGQGSSMDQIQIFLQAHQLQPANNLNIIHLLRCPKSGTSLRLSDDHSEIISQKAGLAYPVFNQIPILIPSEARSL